jgi:hypothetical protein
MSLSAGTVQRKVVESPTTVEHPIHWITESAMGVVLTASSSLAMVAIGGGRGGQVEDGTKGI